MLGLSQREAGEEGSPNWMLIAVLLVEFVVEGDLGNVGIKDATCHVDSKSHYLVLPSITLNDLILLNITQGPVTMLNTFPSLLTCLTFLAGRSIGSSTGTSSCLVVQVAPLFRAISFFSFFGILHFLPSLVTVHVYSYVTETLHLPAKTTRCDAPPFFGLCVELRYPKLKENPMGDIHLGNSKA